MCLKFIHVLPECPEKSVFVAALVPGVSSDEVVPYGFTECVESGTERLERVHNRRQPGCADRDQAVRDCGAVVLRLAG